MRGALLKLLILMYATTGVACACPALSANNDAPHGSHAAHNSGESSLHDAQAMRGGKAGLADCCSDCDELSGDTHAAGDQAPAGRSPVEKDSDSGKFALPATLDWKRISHDPPAFCRTDEPTRLLPPTPVTLKDRMLD